MPVFQTTRRVEFHDTDAAGIMHFSAYFTKMEEVEHELLRSLGFSVVLRETPESVISWPRVSAHCDFRAAARFEEELTILAHVARLGEKSVTYTLEFRRGDKVLATGRITTVCCRMRAHQPPQSIPIPDDFRAKLAGYLVAEDS